MSYPNDIASDGSLFILRNNVSTSLNGGVTSSATSMTLASSANLPPVGYVTVGQEAIYYTGNDTATGILSGITRGADSTTAVLHSDGSLAYANFVSAHHNTMKDEIIKIETDIIQRLGSGTATITIPASVTTNVNGPATFSGASLTVNAPSEFNTATTINATMTVNTTTVFNGAVIFNGSITGVSGMNFDITSTFQGPVIFNSYTVFNQTSTFNEVVTFNSGTVFNQTATFHMATSYSGGAYFYGEHYIYGTLSAMGGSKFYSSTGFFGLTTFNTQTTFSGPVTMTGGFVSSGLSEFKGTLTAATTTVFSGVVTHNTSTTFNGPVTLNTTTTFNTTTSIKGTVTNDDAATGYVGECVEGIVSAYATITTDVWGDITAISLTAGDWEIGGLIEYKAVTATFTTVEVYAFVIATAGNSASGAIRGYNFNVATGVFPADADYMTVLVPEHRVKMASNGTRYLKYGCYGVVAGGSVTALGTIRAKRRR